MNADMVKANSQPGTPMETSPLMSVEITEIVPCEELSRGNRILSHVRRNLLLITTLIGVVVGFGIGFGVRPYRPTDTSLMWIGILGELYMRSLKVTILPLIVSSVIAGAASMDPKSNGKVSMLALAYVLVTNLFGVLMALALFFSFNIGLIIICTLLGMATAKVGEAGRPFIQFFKATSDIVIQALRWLIWFTPVGVASLIAHAVAKERDIENTFRSLGMFVMAYVIGIVLLLVVAIPLAYFIVVRKNPFMFLYHLLRPFVTAFATASSAVAIPEVLNTCETKHGVCPNISRFFIPFATALNRTGSCIFITMAGLLLCSMEGQQLEGVKILFLAILSTVSSLAIPAVPSGSIICILIILSSIGVHTTNVGLLMALEWFTDRLRTGANIASITFGGIFIHVICKDSLGLANSIEQNEHSDTEEKPDCHKNGNIVGRPV